MTIGVAAVGDVLDINCWSSTPYYFVKASMAAGLIIEPWSLNMNLFHNPRRAWNARQWVTGRGVGGYQYSDSFLNRAEQQIPKSYFSSTVISFNQVFPRARYIKQARGKICYYIDTTLHDFFNESDYVAGLPQRIKESALKQERENYSQADAIIVMGNWVKPSLIQHYGIDSRKIYHVLPGANMDLPTDFEYRSFRTGAGISRPLVLGFIGKDWKRKGLPLLLDIRDILTGRGYKVKVKAIGNCPSELRQRQGLDYSGFIDKGIHTHEFIKVINECDIGCLFSKSEALGISTLEFLRTGIPVGGYYHQGLTDTLLPGASLVFDLTASLESISDRLESYLLSPDEQRSMFEKAKEYSTQLTWANAVSRVSAIIRAL